MPNKKKMSKITDIYSAVKSVMDLREDIFRYYHYDSECFDAIEKHIARAPDCGLIDRRGMVRGSSASYGVHFKAARVSFNDPDNICIDITVDFADEFDDDRRWSEDYTLCVPVSLEKNFSKTAFNRWVVKCRKEITAKRIADKISMAETALEQLLPYKANKEGLREAILKEVNRRSK